MISLTLLVLIYVLPMTFFGIWLKKSNIKNWWLIYIPFAQNYKMHHYMFDVYRTKDYKEPYISDSLEYIEKRRTWALISVFAIMIVFGVLGIIVGGNAAYTEIENAAMSGDSAFVSAFFKIVLINLIVTLIYQAMIFYPMYRSVSRQAYGERGVENGQFVQFSRGKSIFYTIMGLVTFGMFFIVTFGIFAFNDKYQYVLKDTLDELRVGNPYRQI